ncbi:hypothetical protein [Enterobacter hormaechei]|uniref:hypothetical protein n=1 Tax=Enterobacter hormaechei TaxID=158836 RepID=UPI003CE6B049
MLDISVSQIRNTVTFVVDKQSIALAKAAADNLQKHFQKIADPRFASRLRSSADRKLVNKPMMHVLMINLVIRRK